MKQILFAVLLCVSSICSAQNSTSKSPDKPQYFNAPSLDCDSFYLEIGGKCTNVVDCDEPLYNILKFKRVKDNEMLLFANEQIYRLTADYPFIVESRRVKKGRFELLGLRVKVRDYSPGMTLSAKVEDSNKKIIFYREYRSLRPVDLYIAYVGTDQKPHIANMMCRWTIPDFDPKREVRFFLKERGGDTMYPIEKIRFHMFDCYDCNLPANYGDTLSEYLRGYLARCSSLRKIFVIIEFKDGTESCQISHYMKRESGK